jgi:hypothetical protein
VAQALARRVRELDEFCSSIGRVRPRHDETMVLKTQDPARGDGGWQTESGFQMRSRAASAGRFSGVEFQQGVPSRLSEQHGRELVGAPSPPRQDLLADSREFTICGLQRLV